MQQLLTPFISTPLTAIGSVLSLCASFAILIFIWGVITYVLSNKNAKEEALGNTRMIWGFYLLLLFFVLWEIIRWIANTISQG